MAQLVQVAEGKQALAHLLMDLPGAAIANPHFAKVGVIERQVNAQVAHPMTLRALRVAGQIMRI